MKLAVLKLPSEPIQKRIKFGEFINRINHILQNFPETANMLSTYPTIHRPSDTYVNNAVYNLLTAYLHNNHMDVIAEAPEDGYSALILLQNHCENITHEDQTRYREAFSTIKQFHDETVTAFLRRWHVAKNYQPTWATHIQPGH